MLVVLVVLIFVGRAPLGHAYHFSLISIRFGAVGGGVGGFCLLVLVVCGKAPPRAPLPVFLISIKFGDLLHGFNCFC